MEWSGDWSDESENWNKRAMNKIGYKPSQETDGIFWMNSIDFLQNFKYMYVCRVLNNSDGWKNIRMDSEWKGKSAAGFPPRKGAFRDLPQFLVTVHKPCSGFIQLRQHTTITTFKGKNYISWLVMKNEGERITKLRMNLVVANVKISNLVLISGEVEFPENIDYPYTFTVLCGSKQSGPEGEGGFDLTIYAQDPKLKVVKIN